MRGGQVTMFAIVGLVLLLTVAIIWVVLLKLRVAAPFDISSNAALRSYVGSCLDTAVEDELLAIGKSGGLSLMNATVFQNANIVIDGEQQTVLYGVTRNKDKPGGFIPYAYDVPRYPDEMVSLTNITIDTSTGQEFVMFQDGYFGDVTLPAICSRDGPNGVGSTTPCRYYPDSPPGTAAGSPYESIQEGLTAEVERKVQTCVDLRQFSNAIGENVQSIAPPELSIMFTESNIIVALVYNITISGKSTVARFDRRYDVRYLPLMEYAFDLAKQESRDIMFDITSDYSNKLKLPSYAGFEVRKTPASRADLITITDPASKVRGVPYSVQFLVEHRIPMLDHIPAFACSARAVDPDEGELQTFSDSSFPPCVVTVEDGYKEFDYQIIPPPPGWDTPTENGTICPTCSDPQVKSRYGVLCLYVCRSDFAEVAKRYGR